MHIVHRERAEPFYQWHVLLPNTLPRFASVYLLDTLS